MIYCGWMIRGTAAGNPEFDGRLHFTQPRGVTSSSNHDLASDTVPYPPHDTGSLATRPVTLEKDENVRINM